jgi:hypothetical protein
LFAGGYDARQFCGAQYVSQQAAQPADHAEHQLFAAVADADDVDLAYVLYRPGTAGFGEAIITRDRVSLAFFLPAYYREKIRSVPGVVAVVPMTYFGNVYKDDRSTNSFAQVVTDPDEYLKVAADKIVPPDQLLAWQRDRTGAMVDMNWRRSSGGRLATISPCRVPIFSGAPGGHDPGDLHDRSAGSLVVFSTPSIWKSR